MSKTLYERNIDDEATAFAMVLLMPSDMLKKEFDEIIQARPKGIPLQDLVDQLAKLFEVESTIMLLRLGELKLLERFGYGISRKQRRL